ncbi:MAG: hypothetical protein JKP92_06730 [Alphaproteobacteria bacterium]|jgi:cell division septum initiation protein DivIVA|nr:hypothetical protein [Alphaproteobacteria bacterium]
MTSLLLTAVLDVLVLAALVPTIYYAWRLSRALAVLRGGRTEFAQRLEEVGAAIAAAGKTIEDLKGARDTANVELRGRIEAAKALTRELKEVCGVAEALAARLESLATKGRGSAAREEPIPALRNKPRPPHFAIRDPEFDGAEVHSRAERELLAALRRRAAGKR